MWDLRNTALQTAFWTYVNGLRHEAKLCDIVLYVKGRKGAMVGYPAHKLLLINASKYFKLLFEREDLRNFCHFPHLSEDGLFMVLDIIYGHEIPDNVNLDDALMAARFLQVEYAVEELEAKRQELETQAKASPNPKTVVSGTKRKALSSSDNKEKKSGKEKKVLHGNDSVYKSVQTRTETAEVRLFRNVRNQGDEESSNSHSFPVVDSPMSPEGYSSTDMPDGREGGGEEGSSSYPQTIVVKTEPDVDLTVDEENSGLGFGQGNMAFGNQDIGQTAMGNTVGKIEHVEGGLQMFGTAVSYGTAEGGPAYQDAGTFGDENFLSGMNISQTSLDQTQSACDICGKVYATAKHLEEHRVTHTGLSDDDIRPGYYSDDTARDNGMVELVPCSGIYLFRYQMEEAIQKVQGQKMARYLLSCFYTTSELIEAGNLTGANFKKGLDKKVIKAIVAYCLEADASSSSSDIKMALRNKVSKACSDVKLRKRKSPIIISPNRAFSF